MNRGYRTLRQWNEWLAHFPGNEILEAEKKILHELAPQLAGQIAVLLGVPTQTSLLAICHKDRHILVTPLEIPIISQTTLLTSDLNELPIASGCVDLVLLPHSLEYTAHPHQMLIEACRIVKPEGHIVITGFNPYGCWNLHKKTQQQSIPWKSHFLTREKVKKWLKLADFSLVQQDMLLFRPPPSAQGQLFRRLDFLEWVGRKLYKPFGGIWLLVAKARTTPLTPIRLKWKQKLPQYQSGILIGPVTRTRGSANK